MKAPSKCKGGRPRRDPTGVAKPLAVRLTAHERKLIEDAAHRDGMQVSDWARRAMLIAAKGSGAVAGRHYR